MSGSPTQPNHLPDSAFAALAPALAERLAWLGDDFHAGQFGGVLDELAQRVLLLGFAAAGAHEGTVWLPDEATENLVPAYNSGPQAAEFMGTFKQSLQAGLISTVFATEKPLLENGVSERSQQSKRLDDMLGLQTFAMIAVPFCFFNACRGVVSCVQLKRAKSSEPDPPGFRPEHLAHVQHASAVLAQLVEYRLVGRLVGWNPG